ncbi:hypothetical protein [Streptococcus pluranimalium]|uniref:phage tail protein n=1 Tax=Streptococcus pluranimalium TaxID=82348 RepID=UPI003F692B88
MNATTLEAYALEKGLNFKWDTASNAEKAELAMKMFIDRTKQYNGNFLKESEKTVAGSLDAMKGAFQNFVAGLGDPEADVAQLMTNLKTTIQNFAKNVGGVVKTIWDNLPLAPWQKWVGLIAVGAGPVLLALSGIMKGVGTLKATFQGISTVLANPWGLALVGLIALVAGFIHAYKHSEKFRNVVNGTVSAVVAKFNELKAKVQPALDFIKNALGKFNVGAFAPLIGGIGLFIASIMRLKGIKIPNPFSKFKPTPIKFPNPFSGLANMAKSAGSAVKNVFVGIGKSIASVIKSMGTGIGNALRGLATVNPATMLAFAVAVLAVGAALSMVLSQSAGITAFFNGLGTVITSVGSVITGFVTGVIGALANAFATIAPSLAMLSPLILAIGQAFAAAAPFVTVLGTVIVNLASVVLGALPTVITAISSLVLAITTGVSQIITALTPIVQIIATTFVQIVTVISQAIVQIVQAITPILPQIASIFGGIVSTVASAIVQIVTAITPFVPAITQMVTSVVSQLPNIITAFSGLASQIPPIVDSLTNLFKTLGEQIKSILDGAKGVIESFGNTVTSILQSVSGIFDSIGNAAKNAGMGVKLMAQGVKMLTDLPLGDLTGTLAAVATGLTAIASSGVTTADQAYNKLVLVYN